MADTDEEQAAVTLPAIPDGWFLAQIVVRRDRGWQYGGALTYDALIESGRGGSYEARGSGPDPAAAVAAAVAELANG